MGDVFQTLDLVIFFVALISVMAIGLYAGRKEDTSSDYYLAGRSVRWWGVAGSIFGSNVSANHMVGMMGLGFTVGFAQSHFELGAIAGLMLLCYGFLPVYRKLNLYTLSEYLGARYDERSRICYAVIMVVIMAIVQMGPGLYIGSRSICLVLGGDAVSEIQVEGQDEATTKVHVNRTYYNTFVIALAVVAAAYTIQGGLKAVIMTDVLQSCLLLAAGLVVAWLTFQRLGGWEAMMALDSAPTGAHKMHLYLPSNHEKLPWTGVLTGLMAMHCFYWGTNQFIVQRALGARSDREARLGIVTAGFLKLTIPFFSICGGIAAYYLFQRDLPDRQIDSDAVFTELVLLIIPAGYGIIGLISAGVIGAILSSVDSMMNSAATIVAVDIYQRHFNPDADDRQMIRVGRISIAVFVTMAAAVAIFVLNPNSEENFFLQIADYQNYLTPGLLVAFVLGIFWRRGTAAAGFATIVAGVFFSWGVESGYNRYLGMPPALHQLVTEEKTLDQFKEKDLPAEMRGLSRADQMAYVKEQERKITAVIQYFGPRLNFFHRVVIVLGLSAVVYVIVSLVTKRDPEKERFIWTDLGGHDPTDLKHVFIAILLSVLIFAGLAVAVYLHAVAATLAAWASALWTFLLFVRMSSRSIQRRVAVGGEDAARSTFTLWLTEDRLWAGLLCGMAMFMMYYFT